MSARARKVTAALAITAVLGVSERCLAQDSAAAEALFDKALADFDAGRLDAACPAFAESQRLDPRPGTLFTLAECEARAGLLASAVGHYGDYLAQFGRMTQAEQKKQRGRDKIALGALEKLRPDVPQLTIVVPEGTPPDASVSRNGKALGRAALGVALPVDPGEHEVVLTLTDGRTSRKALTLAKGAKERVVLDLPAASAPEAPAPASVPPREAPVTTRPGSSPWPWVIGGVGVAGIAVGSVTGLMVLGKKKTIQDHCDGPVCDVTGKEAADSAKTLGWVSTAGFGVGVVGVGVATALLIGGGSQKTERATRTLPVVVATERGAWLGLRGAL
ncbi:MAG: hypothetical protein HYZ29_15480 [Myxococcales bacterium]|nr:hypothetical protein [Myxococcales bacterium]